MTLRHFTIDALGLVLLLALSLAPLGFYLDDSGLGWFWPGLGGFHFDTTTN